MVVAAGGERDAAAALADGSAVRVGDWLTTPELAETEEALAAELAGLAGEERLALVLGDPPPGAEASAALVVDAVHRRPLADVLAALQAAEDGPVVLAGDPDTLPGQEPGRLVLDLVAWGGLRVHDRRAESDGPDGLGVLRGSVREGRLPELDPADRTVVVVPAADDTAVRTRVTQVVRTSLPRVVGVAPEEVLVLGPLRRGEAGVVALSEVLGDELAHVGLAAPRVMTVHEAAETGTAAPAVVLVLPGLSAGVLSRALVLAAAQAAVRQLTVVTAVGAALPQSVAAVTHRPARRTGLPRLLRAAAAELA